MKTLKILPFLGLILLLFSCNEEKKFESPVLGSWVLKSVEVDGDVIPIPDTVNNDLKIDYNKENKTQVFSQNFAPGGESKGTWSYNDTLLKLTFIPPNTDNSPDSMALRNDKTGVPSLILYQGKDSLATIDQKGNIVPFEITQNFEKLSLTDREMRLLIDDMVLNFDREKEPETGFSMVSIGRGAIGMVFLILLTYLFSSNRKKIDWNLVIKGLALQLIIALAVLKVPLVASAFDLVGKGFIWVIEQTNEGTNFVFGDLETKTVQPALITFAVKVLPTIIFFSALMSLLYYWGVLQKVVYIFAWVMKKFMRLSGAESLAAAGNVFLGQTESPLLVKPYLLGMTKSEIMCLMTGGMATIAGGVLAAYIGFLGGDDPVQQAFFAKHLLTASIISAPAAVVAAKILVPETEEFNEDLSISKDKIGTNVLEAIANGTTDGLKLAVNVGAMLLVFIALMALANGILGFIGSFGLNEMIAESSNHAYDSLSFQYILGHIGAPIVWIMGVEWNDSIFVGELLGQKTILNEFVAYPRLGELKDAHAISEKSIVMSTYMLCGFANFASIGIQIGGIGALIPSRKGLLSQLGVKALIGGTVASLFTAVVVGMMM